MGRRWSVPFYRLTTMFVYITGNIFDKRKFMFKLYLFQVLLVSMRIISTLVLPVQSTSEGEENLKFIVDLIIGFYALGMMMHFGVVHETVAEMLRHLREGFSNYSSFDISADREEELERIQTRMKASERVMIINCAKAICVFVIYPILYGHNDSYSPCAQLYNILGLPNDWVFKYLSIVFNLLVTISACSFHNNWQFVMFSSICHLKGELGILADSITGIDQRARNMFDALCRDLDDSCWSTYLRPDMPRSRRHQRKRIDYDERIREQCLFECLKESICHHQSLIKATARLNKVVGTCALMYAHTVGITVAISLFLIAQQTPVVAIAVSLMADDVMSPRVLLYCLIVIPTLMSQGMVCFFGQDLLDESERMRYSLYKSNWQNRSKRYISCLRIMMLVSHRPLCVRTVIYTVGKSNFVEFLKGAYSFLNFLLSMNASNNSSK